MLQAVAQLVLRVGNRKVAGRITPRTALDCDDVEPGLRQLVRENGAGPSETDDNGVFSGKPTRHCLFSLNGFKSTKTEIITPLSKVFTVTSLDDWQCRQSAT